jgi:hypothetical protein
VPESKRTHNPLFGPESLEQQSRSAHASSLGRNR